MGKERVSTGIDGLDMMLRGGLLEGRSYTLIGGPGSGKSILGWQFLRSGVERGENALYITLDEPFYEIKENMMSLDIFDPRIKIMDLSPERMEGEGEVTPLSFLDKELTLQLKKLQPSRVVFDSTTSIKAMESDPVSSRRRILSIMKTLSEHNEEEMPRITSILISEEGDAQFPIETYLGRGVIRLVNRVVRGSRVRALVIEKMRGSSFDEGMRPLGIKVGGIEVSSTDVVINEI